MDSGLAIFLYLIAVVFSIVCLVIFFLTYSNTKKIIENQLAGDSMGFIDMSSALSRFLVEFETTGKLSKSSQLGLEQLKHEVNDYKERNYSVEGVPEAIDHVLADIKSLQEKAWKVK